MRKILDRHRSLWNSTFRIRESHHHSLFSPLSRFIQAKRFWAASFLVSGLIIGIPMAMILLQPDLGTSLVFIPIFLTMIYIAGTPMRYLAFVSIFYRTRQFPRFFPVATAHPPRQARIF
jgi:cell division protein FtsW (lipid II flippase)